MKKKESDPQVLYMDRWVSKKHFRAFVHHSDGSEKLAENHDDYLDLVSTGTWFDTAELAKENSLKYSDQTLNEEIENIVDEKKRVGRPPKNA